MRQFRWIASGTASRLALWFGLFALCAVAGAQQQPPPPRDPENIESMFSFSAFYWKPDHGTPAFRGGTINANPSEHNLDFPDVKPRATGATLTFPTGGFNRLEIGYFQIKGDGTMVAPRDVSIEGANIKAGQLLGMRYKLTNMRVSWNYLTFPVPPLDSRLRVKTFWEVQYTKIKPQISFPDIANSSTLSPDQTIFYPGIGLGLEYVASQKFRVEARGSGMGFPGRSRYLDTEATAVGRIGPVEIFGGAKLFHVRSSPKNETYLKTTLWGPLFGIRYVFPK